MHYCALSRSGGSAVYTILYQFTLHGEGKEGVYQCDSEKPASLPARRPNTELLVSVMIVGG